MADCIKAFIHASLLPFLKSVYRFMAAASLLAVLRPRLPRIVKDPDVHMCCNAGSSMTMLEYEKYNPKTAMNKTFTLTFLQKGWRYAVFVDREDPLLSLLLKDSASHGYRS